MAEPKWKTKPFTVTGWIGFGLFLLIVGVDVWLAIDPRFPTLSQYVQWRYADQALFGIIIIGMFVWLGLHWFAKRKK